MEFDPVAGNREGSPCLSSADGGVNHIDSAPHASGNAANQAGPFFSLPDATTYKEQLSETKGRGLAVAGEGLAIARLRDLSCYRLRGCWLTLERDGPFIEGASFDDIWEVYQLDRGPRT